jgi:UDP-N-acetylmuramate dehydrogenase
MSETLLPGYAGTVRANAPLAHYTTWRIGGCAQWLMEPNTQEQFLAAYRAAREMQCPFTVIGRGSNLLVDDEGVPGVVALLRRGFDELSFDAVKCQFHAEAGCPMAKIATAAEKQGVEGLVFLLGIPGTIGAGVAINAGTGGVTGPSIADIFVSARALDAASGEVIETDKNAFGFAYRHSTAFERQLWVLSAVLQGRPSDDPAGLAQQAREILARRAAKQPLNKAVSGSVFKPPPDGTPPGLLIDQLNLKGLRIGGALVSPKHANWIENDGTATSQDVRLLMSTIQQRVQEHYGVWLEREVRFLPDDCYAVSLAPPAAKANKR